MATRIVGCRQIVMRKYGMDSTRGVFSGGGRDRSLFRGTPGRGGAQQSGGSFLFAANESLNLSPNVFFPRRYLFS